jgi:hypothetical protein
MEHPPRDQLYESKLEAALLQLLQAGPRSFHSLVAHSEGAYPTDVLAVLRRLQQGGSVRETEDGNWSSRDSGLGMVGSQADEAVTASPSQTEFPEPHPLDFDWRFHTSTLGFLDRRLDELGPGSVAVLGAPTLFRYLADQGKCVHLFDKNVQIVEFLKNSGYEAVTHCDLFHYSPDARFECVVADPPWYLDYYLAFLATAGRLLVPEGKLLLSMLPRLTRPTAEADRGEIGTLSFQNGFDLVKTEPALLAYVSPLFESEALKAEGLDLPVWRSGDLYTYVRSSRAVVATHDLQSEENQLWRTFNVGPMIVKVKWDGSHKNGTFAFQKVSGAASMRLRSVSRRSPIRSRINLWTSRNLALNVTRPDFVCEGLELLLEGYGSGEAAAALMAAEKLSTAEVKDLNALFSILLNEAKE